MNNLTPKPLLTWNDADYPDTEAHDWAWYDLCEELNMLMATRTAAPYWQMTTASRSQAITVNHASDLLRVLPRLRYSTLTIYDHDNGRGLQMQINAQKGECVYTFLPISAC